MHGVSSNWRRWLGGLALALALSVSAPMVLAQGESATTRPVPREGKWMELHERFLERAKSSEGIDLLFLGDSITQGWGNYAVWQGYYGSRNAANFGIGGDRTEHVLWRIQNGEIDGISPKVVVLMIGTNNSRDNSADEIADGITTIVKTLREKLPKSKVLLLGVFPHGETPDNPARAKLAAVNQKIAKLDDGDTVKYLDIGKRFLNDDGTIARDHARLPPPEPQRLPDLGRRHRADALVDARREAGRLRRIAGYFVHLIRESEI